jgi:hypothetical protein
MVLIFDKCTVHPRRLELVLCNQEVEYSWLLPQLLLDSTALLDYYENQGFLWHFLIGRILELQRSPSLDDGHFLRQSI